MKRTDIETLAQLYTESKSTKEDVKDKADIDDDGKVDEYEKKRSDAILKNDKDKENDKHVCALEVEHAQFGKGRCIFSEHAEPDENGNVSWYRVMFEHGPEVVETKDVDVVSLTEHDNH